MKATLTTILFLISTIPVFSQSNFYKIGIGGGGGITQSFTDVQKHSFGTAGYGILDYFFTPFISFGLEGQMGQINGGDINTDPANRQFINDYKAISFNSKICLGTIINYENNPVGDVLKGLYIGAGIGVVQNSMSAIVRYIPGTTIRYPGQDKSKDILVPLNLGLNVYLPDHLGEYRYVLNVNFQSNLTFGEGLDGYNDSSTRFRNNSPDIYSFISVGLRYNFGPVGLSTKTFRRP